MRALTFSTPGGPEVLELVDVPEVSPGPGEVLVQVAACAVHPADIIARVGAFAGVIAPRDRYVLGWDMVGTVVALGEATHGFSPGQAVVGSSDWLRTLVGTQAEQVVLPAAALAPAPATVSKGEAATLPVNALTAAQALDLLELRPGETLAVIGAAGGVGRFLTELAVAAGAKVLGIASEADADVVTAAGATYVQRGDNISARLRAHALGGVDALADTAVIGASALACVRDGGRYLGFIAPYAPASERGVTVDVVGVHSDGARLAELVSMVDSGTLTLGKPQEFALADAVDAHRIFAKGGHRGGIVLRAH
jgi:NADPH:quinone reductase-like Zn-dependent oxidoreductase